MYAAIMVTTVVLAGVVGFVLGTALGGVGILLALPAGMAISTVGCLIADKVSY